MRPVGIYIHIPFCRTKCLYCDFVSFPYEDDKHINYQQALLQELSNCEELNDVEIQTIFIGGGTPTVLSPVFLCEILQFLYSKKCAAKTEVTIEANPGTLNVSMLRALHQSGVNRLSIGLQAVQGNILQKIGRSHSYENFLENYNSAVMVGFNNINVDLMFSLPMQTMDDWHESLEKVIELNPQHISAYALTMEEHGVLKPLDSKTDRQMYYLCKKILKKNGFEHYEISNFAKDGYACRHNIKYWAREEYLGFGLGAHSFFKGRRFCNTSDLGLYINNNGAVKDGVHILSEKDAMEELIFLGLRMIRGIPENALGQNYEETVQKMLKAKLLKRNSGRLSLTAKGLDISNYVMGAFL